MHADRTYPDASSICSHAVLTTQSQSYGKYVQTALKALHLFHRDIDYTVRRGQARLCEERTACRVGNDCQSGALMGRVLKPISRPRCRLASVTPSSHFLARVYISPAVSTFSPSGHHHRPKHWTRAGAHPLVRRRPPGRSFVRSFFLEDLIKGSFWKVAHEMNRGVCSSVGL